MLKIFRKYFKFVSFRLFILLLLLLFVFGYYKKESEIAKAFNSGINIFPSVYKLENDDSVWKKINNSFYQDLDQDSQIKDFNQKNSAYLVIGTDLPIVGDNSVFFSGENNNNENSETDIDSDIEDGEDVDIGGEVVGDLEEQGDDEGALQENSDINVEEYDEAENNIEEMLDDSSSSFKNENNVSDNSESNQDEVILDEGNNDDTESVESENEVEESHEVEVEEQQQEQNSDAVDNSIGSDDEGDSNSNSNSNSNDSGSDADADADLLSFSSPINFIKDIFKLNFVQADEESSDEEVINNEDLEQSSESIIFQDFSLMDDFSEEEMNSINLRISMAGESNLANASLIFFYNIDGDWNNLGEFNLNNGMSNFLVGDYFSLKFPEKLVWSDLEKLKIKVSYLSNNEEQEDEITKIFLDALWLEIDYGKNVIADEEVLGEEDEEVEDTVEDIIEKRMQKKKSYDLLFLSERDDFRYQDNPIFSFQYKRRKNFLAKIGSVILGLFRDEYSNLEIKSDIILPDGNIDNSLAVVEQLDNGEFRVDFKKPKREFQPGTYKIKIIIYDQGEVYEQVQDFSWGVLALNFNKSIYELGNRSYLQMAVLDDGGHTLCSSDLSLVITAPNGHKSYLNTDNNLIQKNPLCIDGKDTVIDSPDYFSYFDLDQIGKYQLKLTALTENGEHVITDFFEVEEEGIQNFKIERIGPTRIYPKANYKMSFRVDALQDFNGEFREYIPLDFKLVSSNGIFIRRDSDTKELSWTVDWEKGKTYEFFYIFDAPDISPEFYLLGPAKLISGNSKENVFEERCFRS